MSVDSCLSLSPEAVHNTKLGKIWAAKAHQKLVATELPGNNEIFLQSAAQNHGREALQTVDKPSILQEVLDATKSLASIPVYIKQDSIPRNVLIDRTTLTVGIADHILRWMPGLVIK